MMQAAFEIAHQLNVGGDGGSDDEGGEEEDFGLGAIDPARMHPAGVPEVGRLTFEEECAQSKPCNVGPILQLGNLEAQRVAR